MSVAEEIAKLAELHRAGALTDGEFAQAKENLLGISGASSDEPMRVTGVPASEPPESAEPRPPMPTLDKYVWFLVIPIIWISLQATYPAVYEKPLPYLADLLLLGAIVSWVARRPYFGWARKFRIIVTVLAVLTTLGSVGQQMAVDGTANSTGSAESSTKRYESLQEIAADVQAAGIPCDQGQGALGDDSEASILCNTTGAQTNRFDVHWFLDPDRAAAFLGAKKCFSGVRPQNYVVFGSNWYIEAQSEGAANELAGATEGTVYDYCG